MSSLVVGMILSICPPAIQVIVSFTVYYIKRDLFCPLDTALAVIDFLKYRG